MAEPDPARPPGSRPRPSRGSRAGFRDRYGPVALVAGGSEGLGLAWCQALAARGLDLVSVAEAEEPLRARCAELADRHGVRAEPVVQDLRAPDLLERLLPRLADREVGLLVCNAATSWVGPFLEQPLESKLACVDLNVRAPLLLVHALAPAMAARGRGGIVLMSSLAGRQGTAQVATYGATKAFDWILGEALWAELRGSGVDVLAWCAGATRTPGLLRSAPRTGGALAAPQMEPDAVVEEALAALGRGPSAVAGRANRLAALLLGRLLPRGAAVRLMQRAMGAQYPAPERASGYGDSTRSS